MKDEAPESFDVYFKWIIRIGGRKRFLFREKRVLFNYVKLTILGGQEKIAKILHSATDKAGRVQYIVQVIIPTALFFVMLVQCEYNRCFQTMKCSKRSETE